MAPKPLVSVVVPAFDAARYLGRSLDSILAQSYPELEVVVVDDASTDGTADLLASYDDRRLRVLRNDRNLGQFGAINAGIAAARGAIVAVQHADDEYLPGIVERQVDVLAAHPRAGAAFAFDVFVDEAGSEFGRVRPPAPFAAGGELAYAEVLDGLLRFGNSFIRGGTSFVRREVYAAVGPFESRYALRGDLDMWLRIAAHGPIVINAEYLTRYRWGHDNLSQRYSRLRRDPELFFTVVDERLAAGDARLVAPDALAAHEGRRAEDLLMVTVNRYVLGDREGAKRSLGGTSPLAIARTPYVERGRLLALWAILQALVRVPRVPPVAEVFYRRWGAGPRAAAASGGTAA